MSFSFDEEAFIRRAAEFFEDPGIVMKGMNFIGQRVETAQKMLPQSVQKAITKASRVALERALKVSLETLPHETQQETTDLRASQEAALKSGRLHTGVASLVGGVGGAFGLMALPIELPVATVIMLRSIADTARKMGYDVATAEGRIECLYVFSLGSESKADDALESSYYASRIALADLMKRASAFIATTSAREVLQALERGSAPVLTKLIGELAAQFELRVIKKAAAQSAPVLGFLGGAAVNALFADFFQECAMHHFGLKKIERERGFELTRARFEEERQRARVSRAQRVPS
jgi:hypothetical protein